MKTLKVALALVCSISLFAPMISHAGNCDHSWQYASDGSHCGKRSADDQ